MNTNQELVRVHRAISMIPATALCARWRGAGGAYFLRTLQGPPRGYGPGNADCTPVLLESVFPRSTEIQVIHSPMSLHNLAVGTMGFVLETAEGEERPICAVFVPAGDEPQIHWVRLTDILLPEKVLLPPRRSA